MFIFQERSLKTSLSPPTGAGGGGLVQQVPDGAAHEQPARRRAGARGAGQPDPALPGPGLGLPYQS